MKKLIVLLLMILPLGAIAQEVKIAFVKTQEVFMAMPEVSGMEKQMADLNEKYRVELKQMQDEYQKKYSDFVAQQDSLTENIKLRRMQEIQDIQERMDNFVQVAQQDVQKKQQELLQLHIHYSLKDLQYQQVVQVYAFGCRLKTQLVQCVILMIFLLKK